jgi:dihydropteroate synthase
MFAKPRYINAGGKLIDLQVPKVVGILNVTPDSFYKDSRYIDEDSLITAAGRMIEEGADILDVGGYSSRPGAKNIPVWEEKKRVLPAIKLILSQYPATIISVDTFRSEIAREAVCDYGAHIINDISGGEADSKMLQLIEQLRVPYILMHMQGMPGTMQLNPRYEEVVSDIILWFGKRIAKLQSSGVSDIIVDPGFGFGKTITQNFEILNRLQEFSITGLPVMAGISRKSMIWKTLDIKPEEALNGTTVLNTIALMNGADILRVHDVREAVEAIKLVENLKQEIFKE